MMFAIAFSFIIGIFRSVRKFCVRVHVVISFYDDEGGGGDAP